jgi:predicted porin
MQVIGTGNRLAISGVIVLAVAVSAFSQTAAETTSSGSENRDEVVLLKQQLAAQQQQISLQQKQLEQLSTTVGEMKQKLDQTAQTAKSAPAAQPQTPSLGLAASPTPQSKEAEQESGASKVVGMFEPYGQLRTQFAAYPGEAEVQDNASRIGINFATRSKIKMFATTEWGVNLVQSETQFNLSGTGTGGFGTVTQTNNQVLLARLGFVGADFGRFGQVAIGKQYAAQYDIAGYTTDRFNVFGGQGTFAYTSGTDGGQTGTGRADRVVTYKNTFLKIVELGVQGQFGSGNESEGAGASLQFKILPGWKAGGTYTFTSWPAQMKQEIPGLGSNSEFMAVGTRFDWRMLQVGVVYAHEHNGDVVIVPTPNVPNQSTPVVYNANGFELYARGGFGRFGLIGGYTLQDPKVTDPLLNPNFRTRYFIVGAEWFFAKNGKIYTESKLDNNSVTATGVPGYSVFTVGFRYDFSARFNHE